MPWIYNPTRDVRHVVLLDGTPFGFIPRKRVFVKLDQMSAELWRLVQASQLINQGGDPVVQELPIAKVNPMIQDPTSPSKPDTSSVHHEPSVRVAVDSSIALDGEKESKAVKKQDDDLEKVTSEKSEVDPNLKKSDTKTEKRRTGSRKR